MSTPMDDRQWPEFADQFDEHAMPCHGCGVLVRVASTSVANTCQSWAEDTVRTWCADCWPHGNDNSAAFLERRTELAATQNRQQRRGTRKRDRILRFRRGGKR